MTIPFQFLPNLHPIFVNYPIGLLSIATLLFIAARLVKNERWGQVLRTTATLNLWIGAAITVVTVITGLMAANSVGHGSVSHAPMMSHRNWGFATLSVFLLLSIWRVVFIRSKKTLNRAFVVAMILATGLLVTTGHKGGELVFRYGVGVQPQLQPNIEEPKDRPLIKKDPHEDGHHHSH